jgi:hypothetical protein
MGSTQHSVGSWRPACTQALCLYLQGSCLENGQLQPGHSEVVPSCQIMLCAGCDLRMPWLRLAKQAGPACMPWVV